MKESKKISTHKNKKWFLPAEIIWLIFTYADRSALVDCLSISKEWNFLIQPFLTPILSSFLEKLKGDRKDLRDMDALNLANLSYEKGSVSSVLSQLHEQEWRIEKYQEKLHVMEEGQIKKRRRIEVFIFSETGNYQCIYRSGGHTPSFFGNIKRSIQKMEHTNQIEKAKEKEKKIIYQLGM